MNVMLWPGDAVVATRVLFLTGGIWIPEGTVGELRTVIATNAVSIPSLLSAAHMLDHDTAIEYIVEWPSQDPRYNCHRGDHTPDDLGLVLRSRPPRKRDYRATTELTR